MIEKVLSMLKKLGLYESIFLIVCFVKYTSNASD